MFDIDPVKLAQLGFKPYFSALANEKSISERIAPPNGTVDVFIGCRHITASNIQVGVIGRAEEMFQQKGMVYIRYPFV